MCTLVRRSEQPDWVHGKNVVDVICGVYGLSGSEAATGLKGKRVTWRALLRGIDTYCKLIGLTASSDASDGSPSKMKSKEIQCRDSLARRKRRHTILEALFTVC